MNKRKRFGVSSSISKGLSETISIAESDMGLFRNAIISLDRIELDPENPRKLAITRNDIVNGLAPNDSQHSLKIQELESLKGLAKTIETNGLIQPIAVYKYDENYRVVAGNRRCLASIIANKNEIEARVFNDKPKRFEVKLIQLIENTSREDLSLYEKIENVNDIKRDYENDNPTGMTAELLHNITGFSLTIAKNYLYVLKTTEDVIAAIKNGDVKNLDKAALIANIPSEELRAKCINACKEGANLKSLRSFIAGEKGRVVAKARTVDKGRGRSAKRVNMGTTGKTGVIKKIIESVLQQTELKAHRPVFEQVNWQHYKQATDAFRKLISLLEENCLEY